MTNFEGQGETLRAKRSGFTLIEAVAASAIISLLLALLLPAVQRVRESSRNVQCVSRLRQLGLSCESVVATTGAYPRIWNPSTPGDPPNVPRQYPSPGFAFLLPYLDQGPLFQMIDPYTRVEAVTVDMPSCDQPELLTAHVEIFICPSDSVPAGGTSYRANFGTSTSWHATWSRGKPNPPPRFSHSLWGPFRVKRPAKVIDGLSQTALFSERLVGDMDPNRITPARDVFHMGGRYRYPDEAMTACRQVTAAAQHRSFAGRTWAATDITQTTYNHVLTPNSRVPDCLDAPSRNDGHFLGPGAGAMTARSLHIGHVNVCFADGSVRPIADGIDLQVWRGMGSVNGREIFSMSE